MFNKSNLLSFINLFDIFWFISFGGMGEKLGVIINDCCKIGIFGEGENVVGRSLVLVFEGKGVIEGVSSEKVEIKDGIIKFGLYYIWLVVLVIRVKIGGKFMLEIVRVNVWDCKLDENVVGMFLVMFKFVLIFNSYDY